MDKVCVTAFDQQEAKLGGGVSKSTFDIHGYVVVLPQVQNIYPVEKDEQTERFCWGFKYISGIHEYFYYLTEAKATNIRSRFIDAINNYYEQTQEV